MVIFDAVLDSTGSWGLRVVEADDENELRAFAAGDPAVTTGTAKMEIGEMLAGSPGLAEHPILTSPDTSGFVARVLPHGAAPEGRSGSPRP